MATDLMAVFKQKRAALTNKSKWGLVALAALFAVPVSWWLAQVFLGLAAAGGALALAGVVGLSVVHVAPVVAFKFANWRLRALKSEAERNPIETLQNQQAALEAGLDKERKAITVFDAAVESFRSSLEAEMDNGFPEAAAKGLPTLRNMERLLAFRRVKYKKAQKRLEERKRAVSQAESQYRVAQAAQRVTAASGETENNVLQTILEDIAFGAVDNAVNASMAELRTAIMVEDIPTDDADFRTLDVPALTIESRPDTGINLLELRRALSASEVM
jgi:hypothetical protein